MASEAAAPYDTTANANLYNNSLAPQTTSKTDANVSIDVAADRSSSIATAASTAAPSPVPPANDQIKSTVALEDSSIDSSSKLTPETLSTTAPESTPEPTTSSALTSEGDPSSNNSSSADFEQLITRIKNLDGREQGIVGAVVGLVVVRYCLPWIGWTTVVVGVLGMGLGGFVAAFYLLAVPEVTRLKRARMIGNFGKHHNRHFEIIDGVPEWSNTAEKEGGEVAVKGAHLTETKDAELKRVCIAPDIDPVVEDMISFTLRDFVNAPMGLVSEGQHNIPLRVSLVTMAMNVSSCLSNMRLPETALLGVFGLQNSFIVHLRAYRELQASRLPIAEYVAKHADSDSVLGRCYHKEERLKQFRSTAKAVCQALVSKNDQQSMALFAVMQEIMATHVLESTLEQMCDPDYVNLSIIDYFNTPPEDNKPDSTSSRATNGSSASEASNKEAPITSLADSILKNAANMMDKSTLERQASDLGNQTPVRSTTPIRSATPTRSTTPQRSSQSSEVSTLEETHSFDRSPILTLKQVLTNKNDHMEVFQEFMAYLQVWDAMDVAQFWLMIDIFHRQIQQGTLIDPDDLRREATSIYDTYCAPDLDHSISGLKDAKDGALLKNLKRNIQRDPARCLLEPQEWALGVLESQHWAPFKLKQEANNAAKKANNAHQNQPTGSPQPMNTPRLQETVAHETRRTLERTTSSTSTTSLTKEPTVIPNSGPQATLSVPRPPKVRSIELSDMVNRRPKTLISNADLSYMIEIQTESGQGWVVTRTFQQLEQLQMVLVQQFPIVQRTLFPRWRLQPSDKVCNGLQGFLRATLATPDVSESPTLTWFLSKEFDQNPEAGFTSLSQNPAAGLMSALAPLSDNIGTAAAQGAKTALRQASEASLTAGRFFKSLGAAVTTGNSSQLTDDDRSIRGSFESEKSIRSMSSSTLALSEQQHRQNGVTLSSMTPKVQDGDYSDVHSRTSFANENNRINRSVAPSPNGSNGRIADGLSAPPIPSNLPTPELENVPILVPRPIANNNPPDTLQQSPANASSPVLAEELRAQTAESGLSTPPGSNAPTTPASGPAVVPPQAISAPIEPKKPAVPLLSNDELDLLIETTFMVLEDMMDFSKSQSIRRMAFGVLRELVRKSYRVAINQSFSEWVEQSTSHEKAVETVRWMKDDLFWPNGEWPVAPTPAPATMATVTTSPPLATQTGASSDSAKDFIQVGDEQYEIGPDGIAVKVSSLPAVDPSAVTLAPTEPSTAVDARTQREKDETRDKARELVKMMIPGSLAAVLGREAVQRGVVDVFEMFQIKELNLGLALSVLEMTVRLIFTQ
ncbi:hypothetical protein BGZ58_009031 [Dissophora ornata]|nr:hypothetical protein BGZ58_009031 [Dissophora ornata]